MLFEDKTQNNVMVDLMGTVDSDLSTEEGTLINHSFRGAAVEFEQAYIGLGMIEQNGYVLTADREHLILRGKEIGIVPYQKTNAVWKAVLNTDITTGTRFSAGKLTYICTEKIGSLTFRLKCEQGGSIGNMIQPELMPIEYLEGYEDGKLTELLIPAKDDENTEDFRNRYLETVGKIQAFGGNREQYNTMMRGFDGVGACKIFRVTQEERRIKIYFLNALFQAPNRILVDDIQKKVDPVGKQGEGEGEAPIYHIVDIYPCESVTVKIDLELEIDTGYTWEGIYPDILSGLDDYFYQLAKTWENEENLIVRILKINAALANVEGIVDIRKTMLNGIAENVVLDKISIPVRGDVSCIES